MKSVVNTMFGVVTFDDGKKPDVIVEEIPHPELRIRAMCKFFPFGGEYEFEPRPNGDESDLTKRVQLYLVEEGFIGAGNKGIRTVAKV